MAKEKTAAPSPDSTATDVATELATELEAARAKIEILEGELRIATATREALTTERAAMWRDYCRLREVLLKAFPEIPDPGTKQAVEAVLAAGQSH